MTNQSIAILAIGANLPSAVAGLGEVLRAALHIVHKMPDTSITAISKFWRTPAFPTGSGPDYLNGTFTIKTNFYSKQLIDKIHEIERSLGRNRDAGRWSARPIDLDIVAYDQQILPNKSTQEKWMKLSLERQKIEAPDTLILPHPRVQDRAFVLAPLAEIAPDWTHPVTGLTVRQMLDALPSSMIAEMKPYCLEMPNIP